MTYIGIEAPCTPVQYTIKQLPPRQATYQRYVIVDSLQLCPPGPPGAPLNDAVTPSDSGYHHTRFAHDARRETLWRCLIDFHFSKYIRPQDCVLELGCGYGHFINNVRARRRIALDHWPNCADYLNPEVEARIGGVDDLDFLPDASVDFVFASNVFEHIAQEQFIAVLSQLKGKLSPEGRVAILQPNYRYAYREYFDDYTHVSVYSHTGMCDLLVACGYEVTHCAPRFLPLTIKSRLKVSPFLIWLYLHSPVKPMGKQMLIVARPMRCGSPASTAR